MTEYLVPYESAESEFEEKRSRFISHVFLVESEAEARARIDEMKKKYYDARHNCWCYLLREGGVVRYSDDGEPQGTAGQPMLNVFQRQEVWNVCCIVTRYFGGILLGASRSAAAEFSFFMAIPTMLGASGIKLLKFFLTGVGFAGSELAVLLVGCLVSFLVSLLVIQGLMNYVRNHSFSAFGVYRIILGAAVLLYFALVK